MAGLYVALEGPEGSGKSTLAAALALELQGLCPSRFVTLTKEQGRTRIGAMIRTILLDNGNAEMDDRAELMLNVADRAQHWTEVLEPALAVDGIVVSDRSMWSGVAYQGYGRGLDIDDVLSMCDYALRGRRPDLVLFVDAPDGVLAQRMARRNLDRFESAGDSFHVRVRDGFRHLAATQENWVTLDGAASKRDVLASALDAVRSRLDDSAALTV